MLFLDGVYLAGTKPPVFRRIAPPSSTELQVLVHRIAERIGRALERQGLLIRDCEASYLALDPDEGSAMNDLLGHSITYRVAQDSGFSLHAGVGAEGGERNKLERLCRYIARPAVSTESSALTVQGNVRYRLKTAYRDGTTHVVFEPLDFLARLAALVPSPRAHLTRYHGVFAPHSRLRPLITPAGRGAGAHERAAAEQSVVSKHVALTWMQRLKRVFTIDIETCARCGRVKVIASIEDPVVIGRILEHFEGSEPAASPFAPRAPPQRELLP